jgi:hypothetical protein
LSAVIDHKSTAFQGALARDLILPNRAASALVSAGDQANHYPLPDLCGHQVRMFVMTGDSRWPLAASEENAVVVEALGITVNASGESKPCEITI